MSVESYNQLYTLNNKEINIPLSQIPQFSTKELFEQFQSIPPLPEGFHVLPPEFADKLDALEETRKLLQQEKDPNTRNKLIACLKVAAVVAAIVITALFSGLTFAIAPIFASGIAIGALAWVALSAFFSHQAGSNIEEIEQRRPNPEDRHNFHKLFHFSYAAVPQALLGAGIIAPLVEALTRESRLEGVIAQQKEELDQILNGLQATNQSLLEAAYRYYEEHGSALLCQIGRVTSETASALGNARSLLAYATTPEMQRCLQTRIAQLEADLDSYRTARLELEAATEFYHRFHNNTL